MTPEENWHGAAGNEPEPNSRALRIGLGLIGGLAFLAILAGVIMKLWLVPR